MFSTRRRRLALVAGTVFIIALVGLAAYVPTLTRQYDPDALPSASSAKTLHPKKPQAEAAAPATHWHSETIPYPVVGARDPAQNYGDLYIPAGTAQRPVIVLIHGGGWRSTIRANVMDRVARVLVGRGAFVWNIEYRRVGTGGGWPTTLTDVASAFDYLKVLNSRVEDRMDLSRAVVVGHSAGGQLAAWLASRSMLAPGSPGAQPQLMPASVVTMAGVVDMTQAAYNGSRSVTGFLGGMPNVVPERYELADPTLHPNPDIPVTCLNAAHDRVVHATQCELWARTIRRDGGHARTIIVPGSSHTDFTKTSSKSWHAAENVILAYAGLH